MAPADTPSRAITAPGSRWLVAYVWEAASFGSAMYATPIDLPLTGTLTLHARADAPGVRVTIESWLVPPQSFRYEPVTGAPRSASIEPPVTADFAGVVAERSAAPARDGAAIPVSIVRSLATALDGSAPLLLEGYGTAGVAVDPTFQPELLAWVEQGGIYALRTCAAAAGCWSATPLSTGRSCSGRRSTMSAPPIWSAWPASRPARGI